MEIVRSKINNYDVYVHDTKKYATIGFALFYELEYTKRNIFLSDLLAEYMIHNCKKYNNRKVFRDKMLEMYSMNVSTHNFNIGEKLFVQVTFDFYDPELVKDDYLKDALKVARDILELNENEGTLNGEELARNKELIISSVGHELMNNKCRERNSYSKFMYPGTYFTEDLIESKEEVEELINGVTDSDLIDLYKKIFSNSFIGAFLIGNIKDEYLKWIGELFKFESVLKLDDNYNRDLIVNVDTNYLKIEDKDHKESILRSIYYCPGTSYKEKVVYNVINKMIGSCGMLLHKILRDKYKLVYHAECGYNKFSNVLCFKAFIDGDKEEETKKAFDEVIDLLKNDDELIEKLLVKVKDSIDLSLYTKDERPGAVFNEMVSVTFGFDVSDDVFKETVDSIEVSDVKEALDKLENIKTHFYKGVKE